jgi:hypothetical protein
MSEQVSGGAPAAPVAQAPATQTQEAPKTQAAPESQDLGSEDLELLAGEDSSTGSETKEAKAVKDAQDKLDSAKSDKAKKEAEKELNKAMHKYKLKVDGEDIEWEGSDEDLIKELQLSKKARKEIQSSKAMQKEIAELFEMLKNNPELVMQDPAIGIDPVEFAKKIIQQQMEQESKSPEQIEREQLQKELEELRASKKREEEERTKEMYEREVSRYEAQLEEQVDEALSSSGLPKSPYVLKRMTDVMLSGIENSKEISPKMALNIVRKEMQKDLKEMFSSSAEDVLEELLGSDTLKRLNKRQLEKIRASKKVETSAKKIEETGKRTEKVQEEKPRVKVSINDWMYGRKKI